MDLKLEIYTAAYLVIGHAKHVRDGNLEKAKEFEDRITELREQAQQDRTAMYKLIRGSQQTKPNDAMGFVRKLDISNPEDPAAI
jgi:hypothetical protein